jgi:hypothetical protein
MCNITKKVAEALATTLPSWFCKQDSVNIAVLPKRITCPTAVILCPISPAARYEIFILDVTAFHK